MPHDVSASFVTIFDSEVKLAFQEEGHKLRNTVRLKTGVRGKAVSFPVYGKGAASDRGASSSDVPTMGTSTTNVEVLMQDKIAAEYSDYFDEHKLNFDDRQELARVIAAALGRTEDQFIIDACEASATTNVVPADLEVSGTDSVLSVAKIRRAKRLLDNQGVSQRERFFVVSPSGMEDLLGAEQVTSTDYANVKALVHGDIDTFLGFKFIMVADQTITNGAGANVVTGLPITGTTRTAYAYQKQAIAYGIGVDMESTAGWVEHKDSYLVKGKLMANAVALDKTGVVSIDYLEAV